MSPGHEQKLLNCYSETEFPVVYPSSVKSHLKSSFMDFNLPYLVLDNCISHFEVTTLTTMDSQSLPAVTRIIISVADLGGVWGVQMHPPLMASNVFLHT